MPGNKVTVIGFTGSGKTTYLTGMYICMSMGVKHFSLLAKDRDMDLYLENLWDMMCHGQKPDPSSRVEKYDFHIAHNLTPVCDFQWLDYPGGILADPSHEYREKLEEDIKDSDCLLLILDGEKFAVAASDLDEYKEKLKKKIKYDRGFREEQKMLMRLSADGIQLPTIGLVVTKCDLIEGKYQEALSEVIRDSFKEIFEGSERVVLLMSVSLGGEIEDGFIPEPFCVEQPIAFAVLTILLKYIKELQNRKNRGRTYLEQHDKLIGRIFNPKKIREMHEMVRELGEAADKWSGDAFKLLELFKETKTIYIEGEKYKLQEYYRNAFIDVSE